MKSPLFALLLIVNLLACPVRCLSCETTVTGGQDRAVETCSCCSHGDEGPISELPASELPTPCGDDCGCQSCFCEGAVIQSEVELPEADWIVSWELPAEPTTARIVSQKAFFHGHPHCLDRQLLSGRQVRVAHQSWLI
ncbi:hypothetical protein Mal15_44220 [Stieleria maiorica]|uniref:Secreted protein n=1 Tax=Stieleria maiorica TaxID=2795974 RepID=A0A5B9MGG7_9BACT|nr:hypothetical protein [Stieleria maiorica]QEG00352.1 hypothetical protein Mal15_44220 [Stieleria maiorica]